MNYKFLLSAVFVAGVCFVGGAEAMNNQQQSQQQSSQVPLYQVGEQSPEALIAFLQARNLMPVGVESVYTQITEEEQFISNGPSECVAIAGFNNHKLSLSMPPMTYIKTNKEKVVVIKPAQQPSSANG